MKKLFITGAGGDIGAAIKKEFEANSYQVVYPSKSDLDLSSESSIQQYCLQEDMQGTVFDAFVHCAGINNPDFFEKTPMKNYYNTMMINSFSFVRLCQEIVPLMKQRKSGHIVAISSLYGAFSRSKRSAYSASKHALNGLVKAMSIELAPDNVLVNTLSPGFVDTKLTRKNNTADMIHEFKEKIPLGRLASVEDISAVAFFLCSEKNTYITGQDIVVDGGYSVGGFQK